MHLILSSQQRILILVAVVLVLFVLWIRLLARMNPARARSLVPGSRTRAGAGHQPQVSMFPRWKRYLAAIMLGNAAYFSLYPRLPEAAQHHNLVDLGTLVDLWFCVAFYGLIELGGAWVRRHYKK